MFTRSLIKLSAILVSTLIFTAPLQAHDFNSGDIHIDHPYARATVPQQTSGSVYLSLENNGKENDKLIKAQSDFATSVEIHMMEMTNNVMKMREVDYIDLKAGSKITMKHGDKYHIMLMGLTKQLKAGDTFPLTLYFEKAGKIEVVVNVEDPAAKHTPH